MKKQNYCAIIGDINRSRDLVDRAKIQRQFVRTIDHLNNEFGEKIVSPFRFRIREGDSFEGLLADPAESYRFVRRMQDLMESVPLSFGIGIGSLSTKLEKNVDTVDGEAFHRARHALEETKKKKQEVIFDFDSPSMHLINALVGLMEKEWQRLTSRQQMIIQHLKVLGNQNAVAKKLGITQPAISKALSSPTIGKMFEAEEALHSFLHSLSL